MAVFGLFFCLPGVSVAEKIIVYSSVYPPYQIDDNGKLTGVNTEIVRAIFQDSGIPFEIKYVPWTRAQKYVGHDSRRNSAIYCFGRNKEREGEYKWVGVYFFQEVRFLTLKGSGVRIDCLDDAKKYRIGLVRGDMAATQLRSRGEVEKYEFVLDDTQNVKKLFKKRVQAIVTSELAARYIATENGFDPSQIEGQYEIERGEFNLALSKKTPDEVCSKLKASLSKLLNDGTIKRIIADWR